MGGSSLECKKRTLLVVGRCGNGKSALGNSILGRRAFKSKASHSSVTMRAELQSTVLNNGNILNVIDRPGLCDFSLGDGFIGRELVKCMNLAKEGIHAVLMVFSVRHRFTKEEDAALRMLLKFFGPKIIKYMIVVFTGGDELTENEQTFDEILVHECPKPLQDLLRVCSNRTVCFDNMTSDKHKKEEQLEGLLELVEIVLVENGGKPFTDDWFSELKEVASLRLQLEEGGSVTQGLSTEEMQKAHDEQLNKITEMVESKLKETVNSLEEQLKKERADRLSMDQAAKNESHVRELEKRGTLANLEVEIAKTKKDLERAEKESAERLKRINELNKIIGQLLWTRS